MRDIAESSTKGYGSQGAADRKALPADFPGETRPASGAESASDDGEPSLRQRIVEHKLGLRRDPWDDEFNAATDFWPLAPTKWEEMNFSPTATEELAIKCLMNRGACSGREMAEQIAIPFVLLSELLNDLKLQRLLVHRGSAQFNDYVYQLTESGLEAARRFSAQCAYDGPAPVTLQEYAASVDKQSIHKHPPSFDEIRRVFEDLVVNDETVDMIGQAIHGGHGFFLYGDSGNGKTSVAERVTRAFGQTIWIPRTLSVEGTIVRLFDPCRHNEVPPENKDGLYDRLKIDSRWVRIIRPTILVGGELTMDRLEISVSTALGVYEAPLQMKSNGGTLVIDDFGRQKISAKELLNRWIVPLDRSIDFLNLPNGKTVQVPFEQLLVFSTNIHPHDLADEAFLRRIPYKIHMPNPSEKGFRELFRSQAAQLGMAYVEEAVTEMIERHYRAVDRPFRACHPRDLLRQLQHFCQYKRIPLEMSSERLTVAVNTYFAALGQTTPNAASRDMARA